jgi:hypothetical protein
MATAAGNILLTLQTKATQGGFTDLVSFGTIVAKAAAQVEKLASASIEYSRQSKVLAGDISQAEKVTKGLVDTTSLMAHRNKLAAATIDVTADQFAKLTKFAAAQAQVMGEDVEPAVARFMKSLTSGRTTALKQFGIELKESGTVADTFAGVMEHVTGKVDDMHVEIRDPKDAWFKFQNNLGTAAGELFIFGGKFTALDTIMQAANDTLEEFISTLQTLERIGGSFEGFIFSLVEDVVAPGGFIENEKLFKQLQKLGEQQRVQDYKDQQKKNAARRKKREEDEKAAAIQRKKKKKPPRRGKGKSKKTDDEMSFVFDIITGEAVEAGVRDEQLEKEMALSRLGVSDINLKTIDERLLELEEMDETSRERMFQSELDQSEKEKQLQMERHEFLMINSQEYRDEELKRQEEFAKQQEEIERNLRHSRIMGAAQMFGDLSALADIHNRKAFNIGKTAMVTEATLSAIVSAEKAWQRGMEVPFIGFALAPLYTAASIAASAVRIGKIASMQYKGGGGGSASPGKLSVSGGGAPTAAPAPTTATAIGEQRTQTINVRLDSDAILTAIINQGKERDIAGDETIEIKQAS